MSFKKASRLGLRIQTKKGMLSVEQLWDLSLTDLADAIKAVNKSLKKSEESDLSFLEEKFVVDEETQLKFDVLKEIYTDLKKEVEDAKNARARKADQQKILAEIKRRQDENLTKLSDEELNALLQ